MEIDEKIQAHVLSVWRETVDFFSVWGREGMLILTDKHLMFITKTEAGMKWWGALRTRQLVKLHADDNVMITHDGYDEEKLRKDLENKKITKLVLMIFLKLVLKIRSGEMYYY